MQEMKETRVQSLGQENPLEELMTTHFSRLVRKNSTDRGAWEAAIRGVTKSRTWLSDAAHTQLDDRLKRGKSLVIYWGFQDKPLGLEDKLDRILKGARLTCGYTVGQVLACIHRKCLSISRSRPAQGQGARTPILLYPQVPEHGAPPGYLWAW